MNTPTRLVRTALVVSTVVAALTGCTTSSPGVRAGTPAPSRPATTAPAPTTAVAEPDTTAPTPSSSTAVPTASALARHIYEACDTGADDAGVVLRFTASPSGSSSDAGYTVIYPIERFTDGHTDPYAVYDCTLTDDTVDSAFVAAGLTDSH